MEVLLGQVTKQAMNYAIRTGITITSTYAIRQCGRLLRTVDGQERQELAALQLRLEGKIRIISPAIDMIELIAARGNTSLESAVALTKSLRWEIQSLGTRLERAVGEGKVARKSGGSKSSRAQNELEVKLIIADIKKLLERIEDAVPLINLAITTSGVNLSTTLPSTVSPSRLLQASTFLTAGDMQYCSSLPRAQQIGPVFTLTMYMLFSGHAYRPHDEEGIRETTWKEVMHKARVKLIRVPLDNVYDYPTPFGGDTRPADEAQHEHIPSESKLHEFAYQLLVVEDLADDRVHTFEEDEPQPTAYEGVDMAGIREIIPIHEISKIFYADTGKILNIGTEGETNNPILLLKRDVNAVPPRRMMERSTVETQYESDDSQTAGASDEDDEQSALDEQLRRESTAEEPLATQEERQDAHPWRLPPNLDLEWMAFEVYTEDPSSASEAEEESEVDLPSSSSTTQRTGSIPPSLTNSLSNIHLRGTPSPSSSPQHNQQLIPSPEKRTLSTTTHDSSYPPITLPPIRTSLSLLEMLVRLTALQQFQQSSHLAIPDELLTFFLSESSTVGAGGDAELRKRVRREARMRVGFDPYDESPIKRRGEEWLEHEFHDHDGGGGGAASPGAVVNGEARSRFDYDSFPHGKTSSSASPSPLRSKARSGASTPLRSSYSASTSTSPYAYAYPPSSPLAGVGRRSKSTPVGGADVPLPSSEGGNNTGTGKANGNGNGNGNSGRPGLPHVSSSSASASASSLLRKVTAQPR
ncbi:Ran-binding-domain-containing protein [Westerdykella ornata]|uniref:Ran-binding-domain-containing protein n=1 Tax=Westerdykella ornata TaxID=318751 RepID=A0A6A6JU33_WESOR|nr:Ran-binding-domain-containing protein [Westerdykella ornata]KAF2279755.1 Ran-binding-domain-containing protein [Westerdykella ornata]